MGKEERSLGETLERKKGHRKELSPPSKYQVFYRLHIQDQEPCIPDANTVVDLQLKSCMPKS